MENFELAKTSFLEGVSYFEAGKYAEAEVKFRKSLSIIPDRVSTLTNLSAALIKLERLEEARELSLKALSLDADSFEAWLNLGAINNKKDNYIEAIECADNAIRINPNYAEGYNNRGEAFRNLKQLKDAIDSFNKAILLAPNYVDALVNIGNVFLDKGHPNDAEAYCRRAIQINPDSADAHHNLGNALIAIGKIYDAESSYRRALQIRPDFVEAYINLGHSLKDQWRLKEAEEIYRGLLKIKPDDVDAFSNLLFIHLYSSSKSPSDYLSEARHYGQVVRSKVKSRFTEWSCAEKPARIRVGLVSGDFRVHPVGFFLESILERIGQDSVELIAYQTFAKDDQLTARIKPYFKEWKQIENQSNEDLARLIHNDGVHVLIDLSGHSAHNRLPVFAWKPAPIQVSWQGYLASTGVAEVDYFIGDPYVAPIHESSHFMEKIWQLPESYMCFTEPNVVLEVAPLPALKTGEITFGCLNNLTKVSDASVSLWSKVLIAVPQSKLLLKTKLLSDASVRKAMLHRFAEHGIPANRLLLEGAGALSREEYLSTYNRIDIALDPFPYAGCTTSVEGLWMGVPIITKRGDRFLSHVGETIAHNAGLPDWIAEDEKDYIAKAVAHASGIEQLAVLRSGLRLQVLASPLFDAERFARNFKGAIWRMWLQWVEQKS